MGITKGEAVTSQPPVTAWFEQYSNVMYTSYDVACETASSLVEPCLDKGDMLFVVDTKNLILSQNVSYPLNALDHARGSGESGDLYTISKIYKEDPTATTFSVSGEFGARTGLTNVGVVGLFKFTPATTGNYEFVSQCSNRGSCVDGICECYKGYTKDDCATQSAYAV